MSKTAQPPERRATLTRETNETRVVVELALEGTGQSQVSTGQAMLDHLLSQLAKHAGFDLKISAQGFVDPDGHHMVEDVAITLGKAFQQALGEKQGIARMAHSVVPLDEALAMVAVDIGGRGYAVIEAPFTLPKIGDLLSDLVRHFLQTFAYESRLNLHAKVLSGVNDHHKAEALFKALAKSLSAAVKIEPRLARELPSTKGVIEG